MAKGILAFLLFVVAGMVSAAPGLLIVQLPGPKVDGEETNLPMAHALAHELDEEGRVTPIAWSLSDPIFRAAVEEKLIKSSTENPTLQQALQAAGPLKCDYVLAITVWRVEEGLLAKAQLYRRGSMIWQDPKPGDTLSEAEKRNRAIAERNARKNNQKLATEKSNIDPTARLITIESLSAFNSENLSRSLARTWALLLGQEPLKSHPARPRLDTPEAEPGENVVIAPPPPPPVVDNTQLMRDLDALVHADKPFEAINLLRDAIDAEPLDLERRQALVSLLLKHAPSHVAAGEARRAADLIPEQVPLRLLASRSWLLAGEIDEAQKDLNEAIARDPQNVDVQHMLGEILVAQGKASEAVEVLDRVLAQKPTAEGFYKRAVAHALLSHPTKSKDDLLESDKLAPLKSLANERYPFLAQLAHEMGQSTGEEARQLLQMATLRPKDQALRELADKLVLRVDSVIPLLELSGAPEHHAPSHERLVLALKLLAQSISDIQAYQKSQAEDALSSATINLREAIRNLATAREAYQAEVRASR